MEISQTYLKDQIETCQNRFSSGDDYESLEREGILRSFYGFEKDKVKGRSNIVSRDFADTIESMMPQLIKPFVSRNDSFFKLQATTADMSDKAELAEEAIRYILRKNGEYSIINTWFKNALLYSIGVCKFYVDQSDTILTHSYEGITEEDLESLLYTITEDNEMVPIPNKSILGEAEETEDGLLNVKIREVITNNPEIKIEALPPEEFLYPAAAESIHDSPIIAHVHYVPDYELVKRGFHEDDVDRHASQRYESTEQQERERKATLGNQESLGLDGKFVRVTEAYIRSEDTGEMRQVIAFGDGLEIIDDNPWPYKIPFAVITPFMMPNQISGLGIWHLIEDIQSSKTQVFRQGIDNQQATNDMKIAFKSGAVDLQALQERGVGNFIGCNDPHADLRAFQPTPIVQNSLSWLAAMDELKASRIGVSKAMAGLDPNALAGVSNIVAAQMVRSGTDKIEYIARTFAETGMQDLILGLLEIITASHPEGLQFMGNKGYTKYVPNENDVYDYEITVGLGSVGEEQNLMQLKMIADIQKEIIENFGGSNPCTPFPSIIKTLQKMVKAMGYQNPDEFFNLQGAIDIAMTPPQEPTPDPLVEAQIVEAQSRTQIAQAELELKREIEIARLEVEKQKLANERFDLEIKNREVNRKIVNDTNMAQLKEEETDRKSAKDAADIEVKLEEIDARKDTD